MPLAAVRGTVRRYKNPPTVHIHQEGDGEKSIEISDGVISPLPNAGTRTINYCFGASGSGKSTWVSRFIDEFLQKNPKANIYYISRLAEDKAFEDFGVKRLKIDESLLEEPVSNDDFPEGSLLIFDDIDTIQPKAVNEAVHNLLRDVLNCGRHRNLSACITSHMGSDYKRTREILNECHNIVCFPHGSSAQQIRYVLKTYAGLSNGDVMKLLKLPSRWVAVRRHYPPAVMYEGGAYLLSK